MNQKQFIIAALLFVVTLFPVAAQKAEVTVTVDTAQGIVVVGGHISSGETGEAVTLNVYPQGKDQRDLEEAQRRLDIMVYHNEDYTTEGGAFQFQFKMSRPSGYYDAYLYTSGSEERIFLQIPFINAQENAIALEGLNQAQDLETYIRDNRSALGFFMPLYDQVDSGRVCDILKEQLPVDPENSASAVTLFEQAAIMEGLREKKISNLAQYQQQIPLLAVEEQGLKTWFDRIFTTESIQTDFTASLSGRQWSGMNHFHQALTEAVVLKTIRYSDGFGSVRDVIRQFSKEIGIASVSDSSELYRKLNGKDFSSYEALRKEYETLAGDSGSTKSSSGGGGSAAKYSVPGEDLAISIPKIPDSQKSLAFSDLDTVPWAVEAIVFWHEKGVIQGREAGKYVPDESVTREEFLKILLQGFSFPLSEGTDTPFLDVDASAWYASYVSTAYEKGIVCGIAPDQFGIGECITRQDMAVMCVKAVALLEKHLPKQTEKITFLDEDTIDNYAKTAVESLCEADILKGETGLFYPRRHTTRAEAAKVLYHLLLAGQ